MLFIAWHHSTNDFWSVSHFVFNSLSKNNNLNSCSFPLWSHKICLGFLNFSPRFLITSLHFETRIPSTIVPAPPPLRPLDLRICFGQPLCHRWKPCHAISLKGHNVSLLESQWNCQTLVKFHFSQFAKQFQTPLGLHIQWLKRSNLQRNYTRPKNVIPQRRFYRHEHRRSWCRSRPSGCWNSMRRPASSWPHSSLFLSD